MWVRYVLVRQIQIDCAWVNLLADPWQLHEALQFACKDEPTSVHGIVERLFAQAIPSEHQTFPSLVPDSHREHAVQMLKTIEAEVFVQMNDGFRIGMRSEVMPGAFETMPQFLIVVYLAIKDNLNRTVFVSKRLMASSKIDDRQTTKAKSDARRRGGIKNGGVRFGLDDQVSLIVGTAMCDRIGHRF